MLRRGYYTVNILQRNSYSGSRILMHSGKASATTSFVLIFMLLLGSPGAPKLLTSLAPVHGTETDGNATTAANSSIIARLLTPAVVPGIRGLDRTNTVHFQNCNLSRLVPSDHSILASACFT